MGPAFAVRDAWCRLSLKRERGACRHAVGRPLPASQQADARLHAPLIGSVCPGRRSRSSRTHQAGFTARGLSSSLLCRFSVFARPALKTSRTLRFPTPKAVRRSSSSLRTGSWEVVCASTPGTISLLPGRRRDPWVSTWDQVRGSPEARAATPDLCNNIQVQGRLLDLPRVGAGVVSARLRGCRTAIPQLFRTRLRSLGCLWVRRGKYAGSIGTSGCHPGSA